MNSRERRSHVPDDKQPEATSVAEVILEQLLLTWKAEFERFRATKMFPEQLDGASCSCARWSDHGSPLSSLTA